MGYTVLARRYRSQSFDQVVGQQPIATTLKNAISHGRVAHAYLFCGTRGVGKTSMARIFARALNAPDTIEDAPKQDSLEYPELEVQERMANAIMRGEDLNVIEIDGASNRGVDEARQLIANAGLAPTGNANYKVYIIDEVHMLTREAFNALLKTMEEPPEHVKFILCTTEQHKVPPTIQSRCQRFDFRNIPTGQIADHLTNVLAGEKIEAEDVVVWQIARLGNGSMRDALSLLDRLIATGQSPLTNQTLEEMFGLPASELVAKLVDAIAGGDLKGTLESANAVLTTGISQEQFIDVLIERFRQLMLIAACGADSDLVELSDEAKQEAAEQAKKFDAPAITYMISLCENLQRMTKQTANPRALFDATMVRLALAEKYADISSLLAGGSPAQKKNIIPKAAAIAGGQAGGTVSSAPAGVGARPAMAAGQGVQGGRGVQPTAMQPRVSGQMSGGQQASNQPLQKGGDVSVPGSGPHGEKRAVEPTSDAAVAWKRCKADLGAKPTFAWLKFFELVSLDETTGVLALVTGEVGILRIVNTPDRMKALAAEMERYIGRRVTLKVDTSIRPADVAGRSERGGAGAGGGRPRQMSQNDRQDALDLPLVRKVLEVFPDAIMVGLSDEVVALPTEGSMPEAGDSDAGEVESLSEGEDA
ncbi:DNA polymerase III subunit tau [Poriferisphaera corsica]|uniref:DNA polymerase III subunit gamma/tau n=1 Tax=Poriferisphaera corsica TaxID=2528020 RepID=A0A517YTE2_9BACT|nr:DNA polymerase III subunit gamma/tau [Poriferisphaera corsica]QDU33481.1 DNA polymerase III subunit tau [Poriferisphaera corsica]